MKVIVGQVSVISEDRAILVPNYQSGHCSERLVGWEAILSRTKMNWSGLAWLRHSLTEQWLLCHLTAI